MAEKSRPSGSSNLLNMTPEDASKFKDNVDKSYDTMNITKDTREVEAAFKDGYFEMKNKSMNSPSKSSVHTEAEEPPSQASSVSNMSLTGMCKVDSPPKPAERNSSYIPVSPLPSPEVDMSIPISMETHPVQEPDPSVIVVDDSFYPDAQPLSY